VIYDLLYQKYLDIIYLILNMISHENSIINGKYIIIEKIGAGSFGVIYKGKNIRTNEKVAIKVEPIKNNTKLLKNESTIYHYLSNTHGIPSVKWFGKDKDNYYMVINLLGDSLQNLIDNRGSFSLKLALKIGIQLLNLLKNIHDKGLVHRDIKPENFLLGLNESNLQFHIIDFGFCKTYLKHDKHITIKKTNNLIGSFTYASVNAHNFIELSRRDDLESLAYILIYLYLGKLSWQTEIKDIFGKGEIKNDTIKNMKINIVNDENIPNVFIDFLKYVRSMEFEEKPNYTLLTDTFKREIQNISSL